MPDPWLTDEGKLHPAAEKIGLPEWEEEGLTFRLTSDTGGYRWLVQYRDPDTKEWWKEHEATTHEAAALLEKKARGWLRARNIDVFFYPSCGWNVFKWISVDEVRGYRRAYLLNFGTWEFVTAADRKRIAVFGSERAALQAGVLAAEKGVTDEQDAE